MLDKDNKIAQRISLLNEYKSMIIKEVDEELKSPQPVELADMLRNIRDHKVEVIEEWISQLNTELRANFNEFSDESRKWFSDKV